MSDTFKVFYHYETSLGNGQSSCIIDVKLKIGSFRDVNLINELQSEVEHYFKNIKVVVVGFEDVNNKLSRICIDVIVMT